MGSIYITYGREISRLQAFCRILQYAGKLFKMFEFFIFYWKEIGYLHQYILHVLSEVTWGGQISCRLQQGFRIEQSLQFYNNKVSYFADKNMFILQEGNGKRLWQSSEMNHLSHTFLYKKAPYCQKRKGVQCIEIALSFNGTLALALTKLRYKKLYWKLQCINFATAS